VTGSKPTEPTPVEVTNAEPLPVAIAHPSDHDSPAQSDARKAAAIARVEADTSRVLDQQRISGIWERTQQVIALSVVEITLVVVTVIVVAPTIRQLSGGEVAPGLAAAASTGVVFLASVANLVIGFYFGRTNHQRVGGSATAYDDALGR
jgi:hypothetical protein